MPLEVIALLQILMVRVYKHSLLRMSRAIFLRLKTSKISLTYKKGHQSY